jgi:hypothetical protein
MRIQYRSSFIDFKKDSVFLTENYYSLFCSIQVESRGFRGSREEIEFWKSNLEEFITQLDILEHTRQGEANLRQFSYKVEDSPFHLRIFSTDILGHLTVTVDIQSDKGFGNNNKLFTDKLSVTFEIDSSTLPVILSDFRELFDKQNN